MKWRPKRPRGFAITRKTFRQTGAREVAAMNPPLNLAMADSAAAMKIAKELIFPPHVRLT